MGRKFRGQKIVLGTTTISVSTIFFCRKAYTDFLLRALINSLKVYYCHIAKSNTGQKRYDHHRYRPLQQPLRFDRVG